MKQKQLHLKIVLPQHDSHVILVQIIESILKEVVRIVVV